MGKPWAFLASLFGLQCEKHSGSAKTPDGAMLARLAELSSKHSFVDVRFPYRDDSSYQSLILSINLAEGYVLIDEMFPALSRQAMPGETVEIVSHGKGLPIKFKSQILALETVDGEPACRIGLPGEIHANQRRQFFRVAVPDDTYISLRLPLSEALSPLCKVNNLSSSGINMKVPGNVTDYLSSSHIVEGVHLYLSNQDVIQCDMEVRSFQYCKWPNRHTIVSGRFLNMTKPGQQQLNKLLVGLQRLARKQAVEREQEQGYLTNQP